MTAKIKGSRGKIVLNEKTAAWLGNFLIHSGGVTITMTKDAIEFDDELVELKPAKMIGGRSSVGPRIRKGGDDGSR